MSDNNNIVIFPKKNAKFPEQDVPKNIDEVLDNVASMKFSHIGGTVEYILEHMFDQLEIGGFNFRVDNAGELYGKDITLLAEAVKSLLYKYYDLDHPMQPVAEELFTSEDNNHFRYKTPTELEQAILDEDGGQGC